MNSSGFGLVTIRLYSVGPQVNTVSQYWAVWLAGRTGNQLGLASLVHLGGPWGVWPSELEARSHGARDKGDGGGGDCDGSGGKQRRRVVRRASLGHGQPILGTHVGLRWLRVARQ